MNTKSLNQQNFDSTLAASATPVLVDFWAEWCGPCKMLAPVLDAVATEQAERAVIAKVNIEESPELANRFGITSVPTLIVFKGGQEVARHEGAMAKPQLQAFLDAHL